MPGKYKTISVDPPWQERGGGKIKRGADRHYALMSREDILQTVLTSGVWKPADDCHLYLWATNNHLEDALWLMRALGFRYVTNVAWMKYRNGKIQTGLGQYFRGSHELLLFGVRGKTMKPAKALPSVMVAARVQHSRKPKTSYRLMEATSPAPRLDMFARRRVPGWDAWGDEVPA